VGKNVAGQRTRSYILFHAYVRAVEYGRVSDRILAASKTMGPKTIKDLELSAARRVRQAFVSRGGLEP